MKQFQEAVVGVTLIMMVIRIYLSAILRYLAFYTRNIGGTGQ